MIVSPLRNLAMLLTPELTPLLPPRLSLLRSALLTALLTALLVLITSAQALAHDLWIEPTRFSPAPGELVSVHLRVGENLVGEPVPRIPSLVNQFIVADGSGRNPLTGRDGADPAGYLRAAANGLHVIGYFSNPSRVELAGDRFTDYLKEEGLDSIIALRAKNNQSSTRARERFTRCAKSLVLVGEPVAAVPDRQLGFPLELLVEGNPYLRRPGDSLPVRLLYQNQPLAGTLVVAINRADRSERYATRTGADGRVQLPLRAGGLWLIKAVHMVPSDTPADSDWSSFWASLTFEAR